MKRKIHLSLLMKHEEYLKNLKKKKKVIVCLKIFIRTKDVSNHKKDVDGLKNEIKRKSGT